MDRFTQATKQMKYLDVRPSVQLSVFTTMIDNPYYNVYDCLCEEFEKRKYEIARICGSRAPRQLVKATTSKAIKEQLWKSRDYDYIPSYVK